MTSIAPQRIRLLSGWFCPFAQRAWIALEESGVEFELREALSITDDESSYHKSDELLAANPEGLVPTLCWWNDIDADTPDAETAPSHVVTESMNVVEFVDEALCGGTSSLFPPLSQPFARAHCRKWIDFICKKLVPPFYRMLVRRDEAEREAAAVELVNSVCRFGAAMAPCSRSGEETDRESDPTESGYFLGTAFSAVDVAFAPWAYRFYVLEHFRGFDLRARACATGGDMDAIDRFFVWMDATLARASVVATLADKRRLLDSYRRYADDVTNSQVAMSVRSGVPLP